MSSILENLMAQQIRQAGLPKPIMEYAAIPGRRYRWDFAWYFPSEIKEVDGIMEYRSELKLLVEIQGGVYIKAAHSTGKGIERDLEKSSLAAVHGWYTMGFSGNQIKSGLALKLLQQFFKKRR